MTQGERDMVRSLTDETPAPQERSTSLQPTYEDSVAPEDSWYGDEEQGS